MPSVPCIWKTRPATFESPNFGPLRNKRHRRRLPTLIFRYPATSCSFSSPSAGCFGREGGFVVGRSPAVALAGADAGWRFRLCPGLSRIIDILMTGRDTITKIINSPPGQLAAGGVLAGIVWKFFERVEAVLTDQTKLEIAVWLVGVKTADTVREWPLTFRIVFDKALRGRRFSNGRIWLVSLLLCALIFGNAAIAGWSLPQSPRSWAKAAMIFPLVLLITYTGLGERRLFFRWRHAARSKLAWFLVFTTNLCWTTSWAKAATAVRATAIGNIPRIAILPPGPWNTMRSKG